MVSNKRILVVEDDPDIGNVLVDLFSDTGYQVICVATALKALEQLKKESFDLVTLDLRLPDMTGNDLLHELLQRSFVNPVVVISANVENLKPHPLVRATLAKPFDINLVLNVVQQYV